MQPRARRLRGAAQAAPCRAVLLSPGQLIGGLQGGKVRGSSPPLSRGQGAERRKQASAAAKGCLPAGGGAERQQPTCRLGRLVWLLGLGGCLSALPPSPLLLLLLLLLLLWLGAVVVPLFFWGGLFLLRLLRLLLLLRRRVGRLVLRRRLLGRRRRRGRRILLAVLLVCCCVQIGQAKCRGCLLDQCLARQVTVGAGGGDCSSREGEPVRMRAGWGCGHEGTSTGAKPSVNGHRAHPSRFWVAGWGPSGFWGPCRFGAWRWWRFRRAAAAAAAGAGAAGRRCSPPARVLRHPQGCRPVPPPPAAARARAGRGGAPSSET